MTSWNQDKQQKAWNFASKAHNKQLVPGTNIPYINHLGNVAMEAMAAIAHNGEIENPDLLVLCALLHDSIEDTNCSYTEIKREFGTNVADGILALSKNKKLPSKIEQMNDSLARIQLQPKEVWMVKLSDRITNLQPPPSHWDKAKIKKYQDEATFILETLGPANPFLANRLQLKISNYNQYL